MIAQFKNVEKTYKGKISVKALDGLSFEVREGEILGLLGPNGSGKTTSINCLLSLLEFDSGEILLFDDEMKPSRYDIKQKIGYVPQNVAVFNELTVYENIDFFCNLYVKDKKQREEYVLDAIKFASLEGYEKFYPRKLSGGLLRRLNIACGIAHKPELIIFDEPTVAVDPQTRNLIIDNIHKLNKAGSTIIYTSHYMEEIEVLCDYIVIMDKGMVVAAGTKDKLKDLINLGETIHVELNEISNEMLNILKNMPDVSSISFKRDQLVIKTNKGKTLLSKVLGFLKENNVTYKKIYSELPTLNDVFLELTGKELRE